MTKNDNGEITTYTYDANDRLLSENNVEYEYDNNGNMILKRVDGQAFRYQYNPLNQLVQAEIPTSGGTSTIDYVYDHDGIRVGKTINGTDVTTYLVDKNRPYAQVLEEQRTNGPLSAVAQYVYGHGLVSQSIDRMKHYYHYDGFHSTRALSDMSGTVTDTYQYDAYGMLLNQTGATSNQYLYRSEQFDPELTSYYLRTRYYHPELGRFSSPDPLQGDISDPMTLHRYLYANSDPVNNIDPSGELTLKEVGMSAGIIEILSGIGWKAGDYVPGFYEFLADIYAPDAGIIGVSAFAKVNIPTSSVVMNLLNLILPRSTINIGLDKTHWVTGYWGDPDPFHGQNSFGGIFGGEWMYSFGSSQMGFFTYKGLQIEAATFKEFKWGGVDVALYTGYVWNLWNCGDYTGGFSTINFPIGSFFFDPNRVLGNKGPWGVSWPVICGELTLRPPFIKKSTSRTIFGMSLTAYRLPIGDPWEVPYRQLAGFWAALQVVMLAISVWDENVTSSVETMYWACNSGLIARSKQIYNQRHNFYPDPAGEKQDAHYERLHEKRPPKWKSGPPNPLSKLLGLIL